MNWFVRALKSTIGKKLMMALTGLFLISFLVVHLAGNLQLLAADGGEGFNRYSYFMGHNMLIKIISYLLYAGILAHVIYSIILTRTNAAARPTKYVYGKPTATSTWSSRNMGILGTVILVFIAVHMSNFWYRFKFGSDVPMTLVDGVEMKNYYEVVTSSFNSIALVLFYVVAMLFLAFHLSHGFSSAFQTLGLNHSKYNKLINRTGLAFAVIVPLLFAVLPVYIYLMG